MLEHKAEEIVAIIGDYENNVISAAYLVQWVNQFKEDDREFILDELTVIFAKTYFSKQKCKNLLESSVLCLAEKYNCRSIPEFMSESIFLDLQESGKSQKELLALLDAILMEKYGCNLEQQGSSGVRRFIYVDDIIATGTKFYFNLSSWLNAENLHIKGLTNLQFVVEKQIPIEVIVFCSHDLGKENSRYRLIHNIDAKLDKILRPVVPFLKIENNLKAFNPKLNLMYPLEAQADEVHQYLNSLEYATKTGIAFRKPNMPREEILFSSAENRTRLENIFLMKGLEILGRVRKLTVQQIRPLGYTVKSHRTLGLGTLFFTYRNIPNNCPIVFWWANNDWLPLFQLKHRGK